MALGNQIVTVVGHCPVRLKGVDVPGLEWSNTGDGPSSPNGNLATVQKAVNTWSCNFVRLPLNQDRWLGTACGSDGTTYRGYVQAIVNWCNANNVYVLLDLHWNDLGTAGANQACTAGQHDMPDDNSTLFWQSVAGTAGIANNPAVFFDLYNEPGGAKTGSALTNDAAGWGLWRNGGTVPASSDGVAYHSPGMQGLLSAIRAAGANNLVWAGGRNWAFDLNGIVDFSAALTDTGTGNGVVYATHIYPFKWGGNGCVVAACFDSAVPSYVMSAYPVMVTEFGPNVGDPEGFLKPLMDWINLNNLSYSAWSMHPGAAPCLISNWTYAPTSYFGAPFLNDLLGTNPLGCNPATATPSPTNSPTPTITLTLTPMPACGNVVMARINCGGPAYTDVGGALWAADSNFTGGSTSTTSLNVTGTTDPTLFKTARWGNPISYSFSLPNGNYQVQVLEAENYWTAANKRLFTITLQGVNVVTDYDLYTAAGGLNKAVTLTYNTTVSNGLLTLAATASVDNAQFSAIKVTWVGPACSPTPSATPSSTISQTYTISPTFTVSPTISPTFTDTPVLSPTPTATLTVTPSISPTWTASPTVTVTPTITATPTISPSFTVVPASGPLAILGVVALPNPNPRALSVELSGPADSLEADIFSVALDKVVGVQQFNCRAGFNTVYLPAAWVGLPNGLYIARVKAKNSADSASSKAVKLMKLR